MRLILACAAAIGGIVLGDVSQLRTVALLLPGALAAVATLLTWRHSRLWCTVALVTTATALGAARAALLAPATPPTSLDPLIGSSVRVHGTAEAPPTFSFSGTSVHFPLSVAWAGPAGHDLPPVASSPPSAAPATDATPNAVRVTVVGDPATVANLAAGVEVTLEGRLVASDKSGPPTLLFPKLVAIATAPPNDAGLTTIQQAAQWLAALRQSAQTGIGAYLPEPQASLAAGVLLGGSGRLDPAFRLDLQRSGLAHLVAIDGFKQVLVAAAVGAVGARALGPGWSLLTTVAAITGYTLLTGAHPSAVRAGLMVGLARVAALTGRAADPLSSVCIATLVMAAIDPRVVLDLGLQLSVSATLGIVLLWPALRPLRRGLPRPVAEPFGLTLAVTLGTLPVTLSAFQTISLASPFAHVLAVPLLPCVLVGAALLAAVSAVPLLAVPAAWLAWLPTSLLALVIRVFGELPGASVATGRLTPVAAVVLAAVLLSWGVWQLPELIPTRRAWRSWRSAHTAQLAPAALAASLLASAALLNAMRPDGRLHVEPLRLARGQAVFIRGPTGQTAVVALGRLDATGLVGAVADQLAVWEHGLDAAVALDANAERGLAVTLGRYPAARTVPPASEVRLPMGGGTAVAASAANGQLLVEAVDGP